MQQTISLLSSFGKLHEHFLLRRSGTEWDIIATHYTTHALAAMTTYVTVSFQTKMGTITVDLDLGITETFDTVWELGILYKIQSQYIAIPDAGSTVVGCKTAYLQPRYSAHNDLLEIIRIWKKGDHDMVFTNEANNGFYRRPPNRTIYNSIGFIYNSNRNAVNFL